MNDIRYGQHFGANEWFVLSAFVVGALLVLLVPRRFDAKTSSVFLMCGENGYKILYSFVIYLVVQSLWVLFYWAIKQYGDRRF